MAYFNLPSLAILDVPADGRHTSGPRLITDITMIVMHATAGRNSLKWLTTDPASNVSAHRLIDNAGQIYKCVPDDVVANHVGNSRIGNSIGLNRMSLGIELENTNDGTQLYPRWQLQSAAWQVAEWWSLYGPLPIVPHSLIDTKGKSDPYKFPWSTFNSFLFERLGFRGSDGHVQAATDYLKMALAELNLSTGKPV